MKKIYAAKAPQPAFKGLIRDNRPVWFFEETGIPYERISMDPMKGETRSETYSKINPFQKVPTLDDDGFILYQSAAIVNYLAETTGKLVPNNQKLKAKHLEWMFYAMTDLEPHAFTVAALVKLTDEKDKVHAEWMVARAEKLMTRALGYLETSLPGKTYLMGGEFYAADIVLGCVLYSLRDHNILADFKNIKALLERYYARPAFIRMMEINGT